MTEQNYKNEESYIDEFLLIDFTPVSSTLPDIPISPSFISRFPNLNKIYDNLAIDKSDLSLYDELLETANHVIQAFQSSEIDASDFNKFKSRLIRTIQDLLSKYPYLTSIWKKFSILQYKLDGVEASVKVLEDAVDIYRNSVELWVDYLDALISIHENELAEKSSFIKDQFELCLQFNGLHFLSHEIWERYIEFETKMHGELSKNVLDIYMRVVKIPLYQYSNFFKKFFDIDKNFKINQIDQIMTKEELNEYVSKYQKKDENDLSDTEKSQVIDHFSYNIFKITQDAVNERWKYESNIKIESFQLQKINSEETENWINYLKFEISTSFENPSQVTYLFERCLVPQSLNSDIWKMYISWLSSQPGDNFQRIDEIYKRCINKFIPIFDNKLRLLYPVFLELNNKIEDTHHYYVNIINIYSRIGNNEYYELFILNYLKFLQRLFESKMENILQFIVSSYFGIKFDLRKKEADLDDSAFATINNFIKLLNSKSIGLVMTFQMTYFKFKKDYDGVRELFNTFCSQEDLKSSIKFWSFIVNFEINEKNIRNVSAIKSLLLEKTTLPRQILNELIIITNEFLSRYRIDFENVLIDNNLSNSLVLNKYYQTRSIGNNFDLTDSEKRSSNSSSTSIAFKKQEFLKKAKFSIANPGITRDYFPEITNKIDYNNIELSEVPLLPTFKNVEKASMSIQYPEIQ